MTNGPERALMIEAARAAGAVIRHDFGHPAPVENKGSVDLVTRTDRAAERVVLERIRAAFPDDALLAEESSPDTAAAERLWVVDPLDGTTNFAHGFPQVSVSIAFCRGGVVVLGAVLDVMRNELFCAEKDRGAERDGFPLRMVERPLNEALLATGFAYDRRSNPDNNLAEFSAFITRAQGVRRAGSAALDLAWTASGRVDGFWEQGLNPWDTAAGVLLITEAGGRLSNYAGEPWEFASRGIVAAPPGLHAEMLGVIRRARAERNEASP